MTVEELDIVVNASVEKALKEFEKLIPAIKQTTKQMVEQLNKTNLSGFTGKIQQAVRQVKQRIESLKNSNKSNEIAIKVSTEDAQKQVTQLQKQIDSLQKKINARQMKLDIINPQMDSIVDNIRKEVTPKGVNPNSNAMIPIVDNALKSNKDFTALSNQAQKLYTEIEMYNQQLNEAKNKMSQLKQETENTATAQGKLSSFFSGFKNKLEQAKTLVSGMKSHFSKMPKITKNATNNIKNMNVGVKSGLGHVLKYVGALIGLRSIYQTLKSTASSWLSSQNAQAQQLSANIEYMKYAMGSALAPVIQFVTNLVYELMKAIQSVAYALTGVNIFANASAKSYSAMAGSAKKAKEETNQLAGIHNEINNIQSNNNSDSGSSGSASPSFDLSQMDNTPNSIIEAIKNSNWHEVGATIGEKLNEAMGKIPWNKIKSTAGKIGENIALLLNGFIKTTDWKLVGKTFAEGLNTIIEFAYNFITTFDWKEFGKAIANSINGYFENVNWTKLGATIGKGIKGIFNTISRFFQNLDWNVIVDAIIDYVKGIDWGGVADSIFEALGSAFASLVNLGMVIGEKINEAIDSAKQYFSKKIEECGGNVVAGMLKGIIDTIKGIGQWIIEHIFKPFIEGFKNAFGIHSPSTVMAEMGVFIIQGLFNGITSLTDKIKEIWENIKQTAINIFNNIKDSISNIFNNIKNTASDIWNNILNSITNAVNNIRNGITNAFQTAYNSIRNIFGNIGSFFSGVWNNVKNTFSTLGTSIGNAISGAVKSGINGVISLIERTINSAIRLINGGIRLINLIPGVYVGSINTLSLPRLAKGGVLTEPTAVLAGEYSGARSNPEIVAPQNIMYDTMRKALEDTDFHNSNSGQAIYLTVNVGNKKLGQILLDDLRDKKRQTGKDIEALVGG